MVPWLIRVAVGLAVLPALLAGVSASAAEDVRTSTALAQVPADADFFVTYLRNREQVDLIVKSDTFKKLRDLPIVKQMVESALDQVKANEQAALVLKLLEIKENRELLELLQEAVSDEVFVYGGEGWAGLLALMGQYNNTLYYQILDSILEGGPGGQKAMMRTIAQFLDRNRTALKVPDLLLGFKLKDAKKAEAQLKRLEELAEKFLDDNPFTKGRYKKTKRTGGEAVLTLTLESTQLPWDSDENPFRKAEDKPGEFAAVEKLLKSLKVTFSLGIKGDYLMVGISPTLADLDRFGGKGKKLVDRKELEPLAKHAKERVTQVGYVSAAYMNGILGSYTFEGMAERVKRLAVKSELAADRRKELEKDLDDLVVRERKLKPPGGAGVGISYLTDDGMESYGYEYGDNSALAGKRLELLDHYGGTPILAAGALLPASKTLYMQLTGQIRSLIGMVGMTLAFSTARAGEEASTKVPKEVGDFLQKFVATTDRLLLPSLRDGELGIVIDARWKSKQWLKSAPEFSKAVPMAEVGLLLGLADTDKFAKAIKEYRLTIKEGVERLPEREKDNLPFGFGAPEPEKVKGGTLYAYPLPEAAGTDKQVVPTAGLGKTVGVFTSSRGFTERLLTPTPLKSRLPAGRKNLLGFVHFDFHALADAGLPWTEVLPELAPPESRDEVSKVAKQVRTALDLLKAFQGFSSATYLEEGILVTHSRTVCKEP
jgi:hypothetical protein